jgi:sulfate permease, SulP family
VAHRPQLARIPGSAQAGRLAFLGREVGAGLTAGLGALPVCIASGVLAYAPLGVNGIAQGAAAGLTGGAISAAFAALFSSSEFVISSPRASIAIIQATLAGFLMRMPAFAGHFSMIVAALGMCGLLAGVWQMLFGLLRLERVIKCTPHPVLAGFVNGVALLVLAQQALQLLGGPMGWQPGDAVFLAPKGALAPLIGVAVAGFILIFGSRNTRLPAMLAGLVAGVLLFQAVRVALPSDTAAEALGVPSGDRGSTLLAYLSLLTPEGRQDFLSVIPALLLSSLALALVAALESLLALRVAQNLSQVRSEASRDVFGQGVGNLMSALFGGVAAAASSSQMTANYEAGGRSRLSVLAAAATLLAADALLTPAWGLVPAAAIWAVLAAIAVTLFDRWSLRALREFLASPARVFADGTWRNIGVAAVVTLVTASGAVIGGVAVGIGLACVLFITDMSRSIVRRRYRGDEAFSKRVRPSSDVELLRETGRRRAVIELQSVMFFGNADELSREIHAILGEADMLTLDLRAVTDIDFSAAAILRYEEGRARRLGKRLLLSSVRPRLKELLARHEDGPGAPNSAFFPDLDAALEEMEEETLRRAARASQSGVPLERHAFAKGLDADQLAVLRDHLRLASFETGAVLCREGDEADAVWILTRGSVSVRLFFAGGSRSTRLSSLGQGTTVGETAFLDGGHRTATIVADEPVECHVLDRDQYAAIVESHPRVAVKLLTNLLRETINRLRNTSDELRTMSV